MRIRERFNPRAPCGARHAVIAVLSVLGEISTHAPLAGRDSPRVLDAGGRVMISTHAPLAGRDCSLFLSWFRHENISTHAPLEGRDSTA